MTISEKRCLANRDLSKRVISQKRLAGAIATKERVLRIKSIDLHLRKESMALSENISLIRIYISLILLQRYYYLLSYQHYKRAFPRARVRFNSFNRADCLPRISFLLFAQALLFAISPRQKREFSRPFSWLWRRKFFLTRVTFQLSDFEILFGTIQRPRDFDSATQRQGSITCTNFSFSLSGSERLRDRTLFRRAESSEIDARRSVVFPMRFANATSMIHLYARITRSSFLRKKYLSDDTGLFSSPDNIRNEYAFKIYRNVKRHQLFYNLNLQ